MLRFMRLHIAILESNREKERDILIDL